MPNRLSNSQRWRGFTLVEVIIVIFILALISGVVLIRATSMSPVRVAKNTAMELHSFLVVAQEQAIVQPAILGLNLADNGYQVLELKNATDTKWTELPGQARFWQPHKIASSIQLTLFVNQQQMSVPTLLSSSTQPQILMLPSGEMTPFELLIQYRNSPSAYKITGNFAGQIDLSEVQ